MISNIVSHDQNPVRRLSEHIATRIADAGGARHPMNHHDIRELAHAVAVQWIEENGRAEALPSELLPRICRALSACGASESATLLMLFDTRLVRSAIWNFHGRQSFWILDCSKLQPRRNENMELMLDRCLTTILDRLAPLWDTDKGRGALGLESAARLAATLDGARLNNQRRHLRQTLNALRQRCADRLGMLARQRGWISAPDVVVLQTSNFKSGSY